MDPHGTRTLTSQLAEDLGWLEAHCRDKPELAADAIRLRLAAALVRNCLGPYLDDQPPTPLHVAVLGGAGVGKSTVVNFLTGSTAAEANPQAGYTRHPVAYAGADGPASWPAHLGFLGPLQRLPEPGPSNVDRDVYQVRRVPGDSTSFTLLKDYVIWDCPDMTTWAATGYAPRLLEVAGLADLIVYVASDERYNDAVPTQFLHLLLESGKPVVVCLTKMREADAPTLVAHFQKEVLDRMPRGVVATVPIPFLLPAQLADPQREAARYRIPLLNQVAVLGDPAEAMRRRTAQGGVHYLVRATEQLLAAAKQDVEALQLWQDVVRQGQAEFDNRYRREYLASEKFRGFDDALTRLLELLELPGVGKVVSSTLWVLRTPYRLLRGALAKALARPDAPALPEQPVLEEALAGWLDALRKEATRRAHSHPLWAHIAEGFTQKNLADLAHARYEQGFRSFRLGLADEVDRTARAIYEDLEKSPALLNTLRGGNLAMDVASVAGALVVGHVGVHDFVLVPLLASLKHQIVEFLGKQYVDNQREQVRLRQQALATQHVSAPLAEWLVAWPATGGSSFERLQLALRRVPQAIQQVHAALGRRATPA